MREFNLSMVEVKNKIRIYRTTYGQEIKKMENNSEASSRLLWFDDLHKAFNQGKIKSFTKSATKRAKRICNESKVIEIEYEEEDTADDKKSEDKFEFKKIEKRDRNQQSSIIIEPYYEFEEEENFSEELADESPPMKNANSNNESTSASSFAGSGMQSNELFLKSLQSTLDKLPDAKNMRARIKIQEVLYQIAYEAEK